MSVLADLAAELGVSAATIRGGLLAESTSGDEALQPTYLTIDSQGRVSADFTGHVHAQGLDLDLGTVASPPDTDRVRWIRANDGSSGADLFAKENSGFTQLILESTTPAGAAADTATAALRASQTVAGKTAGIYAQYDPAAALFGQTVQAQAGDFVASLITGGGLSSFFQIVIQERGTGNLASTTLTATTRGLYLLTAQAYGPNLSDQINVLWSVHENVVQSAYVYFRSSYAGNLPLTMVFGSAVNVGINTNNNMPFVGAGNANQVTLAAGGATSAWAYTLGRLHGPPTA